MIIQLEQILILKKCKRKCSRKKAIVSVSATSSLIYNFTVVMVISYSQFMVWSPQPANPQPADHRLPHSGMGERIRRAMVRKCVRHGIKAVLKMRKKGRRTQTDQKEVTSDLPQADQCLVSLQRGSTQFCGWAGTMWHPASLWAARGAVLAVPAPSLLPAPWGTELRSRESPDTLQALFSNTSDIGVLSAQI